MCKSTVKEFVVVYKHLNPWYTLGHQSLGLCEIYLLGCLRHLDKHEFHSLISCGYLLLFTSISMNCDHGSDGVSTQSQCWMVVLTSIILLETEVPYFVRFVVVNPRRTCARVTVVVVSVCVCVCVCVSVKSHLTSGTSVCSENTVTNSVGDEGRKICGVFSDTAPVWLYIIFIVITY